MKTTRAWWITLGTLALLIVLPLLLRKDTNQRPAPGTRRLVIFTPHSESIRREFSEAFPVTGAKDTAKMCTWIGAALAAPLRSA